MKKEPEEGQPQEDPPIDDPEGGQKDFRQHVLRLYLRNEQSAEQTKKLLQKAEKAGTGGLNEYTKGQSDKNAQTSLMRACLEKTKFPKPYWAQVPVADPKRGLKKVMMWLPFLLIHEVLFAVWSHFDNKDCLFNLPPGTSGTAKMRDSSCKTHKIDPNLFISLGLHGDGVPTNKG